MGPPSFNGPFTWWTHERKPNRFGKRSMWCVRLLFSCQVKVLLSTPLKTGANIVCLPPTVHPDLWGRTEDSPGRLPAAQRPAAQRLQLRCAGQAARHGAVQPAALPRLRLLAPPPVEAGTIVLTHSPPHPLGLSEGTSLWVDLVCAETDPCAVRVFSLKKKQKTVGHPEKRAARACHTAVATVFLGRLQPTQMGPAVAWRWLESEENTQNNNAAPLRGSLKTHGARFWSKGSSLRTYKSGRCCPAMPYIFCKGAILEYIYCIYEAWSQGSLLLMPSSPCIRSTQVYICV